MTTVREALERIVPTKRNAGWICPALGIDPDLDLDRYQLVAVCKACGNAGSRHLVEWYQPGGHPVVGTCPDCAEAQAKGEAQS